MILLDALVVEDPVEAVDIRGTAQQAHIHHQGELNPHRTEFELSNQDPKDEIDTLQVGNPAYMTNLEQTQGGAR